MRIVAIVLGASGLAVAGSGHALASEPKADAKKAERMVCRTTHVTGTRFEKRTCKTAAQWDQEAERHGDGWREQMARPVINRQGETQQGFGQ